MKEKNDQERVREKKLGESEKEDQERVREKIRRGRERNMMNFLMVIKIVVQFHYCFKPVINKTKPLIKLIINYLVNN